MKKSGRALLLIAALATTLLLVLSLSSSSLLLVAANSTGTVVALDGSDWKAVSSNGSVSVAATVPGSIYTDLMAAGVIGDPYAGYNEHTYRWVSYDPYWTFAKEFTPFVELFNYNHIDLIFDGIDTIANITLNGVLIASTDNMFRRYTLDVTSVLKAGTTNKLVVTLQSPSGWAGAYAASYPYTVITSDPDGEIPYRNYIRKGQSDFGWDWGPGLGSLGIWKSVRLSAYSEVTIHQMMVQTTAATQLTAAQRAQYGDLLADTDFAANVTVFLRVSPQAPGGTASGTLSVDVGGFAATTGTITLPACPSSNGDFSYAISVLLVVQSPQLWWPVGYGEPNLSSASATFVGAGGEVSTAQRTVGFRTIEIVRDPIKDLPGLSFYFRVNGVPVYAKGSNMVPIDAIHTRANETYTERLIQSAVWANHNIIRVWGGGVYQTDYFYDLTDRYGLLVWQEFAFACAMYPISDWFLVSVREEVTQQLRRLQSHPSIAVFGGNNENEAALDWFSSTETERDFHLVNYNQLYVNVVRDALLREIGMSIEFVVSSPSNGPLTLVPFTQRWGDVGDLNYGDVHTYNYVDDCSNPDIYPRARFVSEFGFQSEPSFYTYSQVSTSADWTYNSAWMLFRQHHAGGNDQMLSQMQRHFIVPNSTSSQQQFSDMLYVTQAVQTICYKTAMEFWRRIQNEEGHTQGIIYWQLNDVWQAPTWSSIEWGGRWKMVHYGVAESFAPLLVSGYVNQTTNNFTVYVINDLQESMSASVIVELYEWATGGMVFSISFDTTVANATSTFVTSQSVASLINGSCSATTSCFARLRLLVECVPRSESIVYLSPLAQVNLPVPQISVVSIAAGATEKRPQVDVKCMAEKATVGEKEAKKMAIKESTLELLKRKEFGGGRSPHAFVAMQAGGTALAAGLTSNATITLSTKAPAAYVWLETPAIGGHFSQNGFVMLPNIEVDVVFSGDEPFDVAVLQQTLVVRSIRDTY